MKTSRATWKIERLAKMHKTKKINFDLVIQRKDNIWERKRQSTLIHSLLVGYPIPSLFASKDESVYHFLDGKQRLTSVFDFIEDQFALHISTPDVHGFDVAEMTFSELPDKMQEQILNYEVDFVRIEDISPHEMEELFARLNNGMPLRQIETTRAMLGSRVLTFVESISELDFFATKTNISKGARKRFTDQEMVLQILALVYDEQTGFSGKELQAFAETLRKEEIQDSLRAKMQNASYYLNEAFLKREKFLKKLHVPMLFKIVLDMIERGEMATVLPREFGKWATDFFENTPPAYLEACQAGSARKENVQKRLATMTEHFNVYREEKHQKNVTSSDAPNLDTTKDAGTNSEAV